MDADAVAVGVVDVATAQNVQTRQVVLVCTVGLVDDFLSAGFR